MKPGSLRNISTDDLQSRIKQTAQDLEHLRQELRRRIGELNSILTDHPTTRRKRQLTITPLHREISRTVQTLRHAKKRGVPKAAIAKLEKQLKRQQGQLRRQNAV